MYKQINWKTIRTEAEIISSKAMGKFKSTLDIFRSQKSYRDQINHCWEIKSQQFFVPKEVIYMKLCI